MSDRRDFFTDCIFEAAAISQKTGKLPGQYITIEGETIGANNKVTMKFSDVHRQLITELKAGMLKVEPLSFKRTVLQLKKQVLSVSDQQKEKQENTT